MFSKRLVAITILTLLSASIIAGAFRIQSVGALPSPQRLDNLVITASDLEAAALNLAQWKNSCGIPSVVLNTTWIYSHYGGVDEPEKIRNCIKDHYENFRIEYVTIFGDADKVPTRYAYVPDDSENSVATDLYYGDLNGTWDDNHDGVYADQRYDYVDGIPEVCVGRIPVSLVENAQPIVNKIIRYQQQFDVSQNWTRRVVLAAGTGNNGVEDTHGYGSEVLNDYVKNIAWDKDIVKLYEKAGNLSTTAMAQEINRGALFVNFAGHGDPDTAPIFSAGWLFYWVLAPVWWNGFGIVDVRSTTNDAKLPVVTTCSCSTARFDDADCIGEWFVGHPTGGAIAYFGSTRIAYSYANDSAPYRFMGEMDWRLYQNFYEGFTRLGEMWRETVKEYVKSYISDYSSAYNLDAKTIMEFVLLGDPSLRISNGPKTLIVPDEYATIQGAINDAYKGDTVYVKNGTYYENLVVNKTINLKGESRESTVVDGNNTGNVVTLVSNNANVSGFTFQHSAGALYSCIRLDQVSGCSIFSNIADNSKSAHADGIFLQSSDQNNISDNLVINTWDGITFWGSSNNTISGNTVVNLVNVGGTSIQFAYGSRFNLAIGNALLGIAQIGIRCYQSDSGSNVLIGNKVENHYFGIYADGSSNNIFYHNNIVNSSINQAYISGINVWDNGYPSGGNYWSDYSGNDTYSGTYQNETGSDGIGDTAYLIDASNIDCYPLMSPWTPPDAAALNISSRKTIIGEGFSTNVTVSLENQGNKIEELNATFYANDTFIGYQTFLLRGNNSIIYSSDWNVSGLQKGNYSLSVSIVPLEGETDLNDNSINGSWVFITIRGDLNGDKTVNILDVIILSNHFGFNRYHPEWDANIDLNEDGIINILDAILVANNFGKSWT